LEQLRSSLVNPVGTMGCQSGKDAQPNGPGSQAEAKKADEKLLDKYNLGKPLGQGAFGVVYLCKNKVSKEDYAVKMIDQVETAIADIKQEVAMLQKLEHPCIVKLHDVYYEKVFVCMVLELYKGGDLIEGMQLHWKAKGMITLSTVQNISKMMVQSVEFIHSRNVIHRDLKGDNYLMDRKQLEHPGCRVFLSDFGTVIDVKEGERLKAPCGTKTYWAPEFYAKDYSFPVDMWAMGVIMMGLVTGRFPFKGQDDVKSKSVKCPQAKEGEGFILSTLNRDEKKRLTAADALKHDFLAKVTSAAEGAQKADKDFKPEIKEGGANAGIQERRRELVERMDNAAAKKDGKKTDGLKLFAKEIAGSFEVSDPLKESKAVFDWVDVKAIPGEKYIDKASAKKVTDVDAVTNGESSEGGIQTMLAEHGIQTDKFGVGSAKTLDEFIKEVQKGEALMMLDAAKKKCLVRVVEVVLLRLAYGSGKDQRYLVKIGEVMPDGRSRESSVNQLPGTKKMPHESARQTISRVLKERLDLDSTAVKFDWAKTEVWEDSEESPSYPGVRTVYKKEVYEGQLVATDNAALGKVGAQGKPDAMKFTFKDPKQYTRTYQWYTEKECQKMQVMLRAKESGEISTLVQAPVGFSQEQLQTFLKTNKVEMNEDALKEFSDELVTGKSQLVRKGGKIVRLVDVVILEITNKAGKVLVQTKAITPGADGGQPVEKVDMRLPAVKRRPDENCFWAAKRILSKGIKISENVIFMDKSNVFASEVETKSEAFANMPTIYRKLLISATIQE